MAWYLLVAALVNTGYFTVHALWISKLFYNIERQSSAPMGRMFSQPMGSKANGEQITRLLDHSTGPLVRHSLFILEALCAVFGYMLISFRWGANSQLCQPEVYWATHALVITALVIIVFSTLTFVFSVLVSVYSSSPWVQDFFGSFWEARLLAKMRKEEEREAQEEAARKLQKAQEEAAGASALDEWEAFQQGQNEDRARHDAIMAHHENYLQAVSQPPPRPPHGHDIEEDDEPLIVWSDNDFKDEYQRSFQRVDYVPLRVPLSPVSVGMLPPIMITGAPTQSAFAPIYSNSQVFAQTSVQLPNSSPVLGSHELRVPSAGMMPSTTSTIYTPPPPLATDRGVQPFQ